MTQAKDRITNSFGAAVKIIRTEMGISQETLAELAGLDRTYVGHVERGARNVSLATINKLAKALKISTPALLGRATREDSRPIRKDRRFVDILLVTDTRRDAASTLAAFKKAKITNTVHLVSDGAEALDYLYYSGQYSTRKPSGRPQLVLLDLRLPKISGLEVLRRIKRDERTQCIPVIILTASEGDQNIAESLRLGADGFIVKPVDFQRLATATPSLDLEWGLLMAPVSREERQDDVRDLTT